VHLLRVDRNGTRQVAAAVGRLIENVVLTGLCVGDFVAFEVPVDAFIERLNSLPLPLIIQVVSHFLISFIELSLQLVYLLFVDYMC